MIDDRPVTAARAAAARPPHEPVRGGGSGHERRATAARGRRPQTVQEPRTEQGAADGRRTPASIKEFCVDQGQRVVVWRSKHDHMPLIDGKEAARRAHGGGTEEGGGGRRRGAEGGGVRGTR
ncbi:hypothetical protein GCM10023263_93760 [Phytohabitans rumicis]